MFFWQSIWGRHKCSTKHPSSFTIFWLISTGTSIIKGKSCFLFHSVPLVSVSNTVSKWIVRVFSAFLSRLNVFLLNYQGCIKSVFYFFSYDSVPFPQTTAVWVQKTGCSIRRPFRSMCLCAVSTPVGASLTNLAGRLDLISWASFSKTHFQLLSPAYEIGRGILKWRCPSVRPSFRPSPAFSQ